MYEDSRAIKMKYTELLKQATPLPIKYDRRNDGIRAARLAANGLIIADVWFKKVEEHAPPESESRAMARLIAHSANVLPQALDALKRAANNLPPHLGNPFAVAWAVDEAISEIENVKD